MQALIQLQDVVLRHPDLQFSHPLNWTLLPDEHWVFIGPNGSGKTLFTEILTGKHALRSGSRSYPLLEKEALLVAESIRLVAFQDITSLSDDYAHTAYQQRWNAAESESSPFIEELFKPHPDTEYTNRMFSLFGIQDLLHQRLIHLSSGELRKFLLFRALMHKPRLLILDNPFIGLDSASRILLNTVLEELASLNGLRLIFVLSNPSDIPSVRARVLTFDQKSIAPAGFSDDFQCNIQLIKTVFPDIETERAPRKPETKISTKPPFDKKNSVAELHNITISYPPRTILKDLSWHILKGECWALLGPNGSGKSTLLSLICADNPQSYANDIRLFGKKRGSGESIWDIKKNIGYVSPEMHNHYLKNVPCKDIVGSGLFDTIGLYRRCSGEQMKQVFLWMEIFGIFALAERSFLNVSSGEQRLCLLARAFVKEPELLILDEPLHGLDVENKTRVRRIIEGYCSHAGRSLIYVTHYLHEIPDCIDKQFLLTKNQ